MSIEVGKIEFAPDYVSDVKERFEAFKRNPAPNAAAPAVHNGNFGTVEIGLPTGPSYEQLRALAKEQHDALKMASDSIIALFRACEPSGNTKYGNRFAYEDNGYIALQASIEKYEELIK